MQGVGMLCRHPLFKNGFIMKKTDNKNEKNYVDKIPVMCEDKPWKVLEDGMVEVTVENKGFYNTIAQKLFSKPRYSFIKLDAYGSFVWQQIDGTKTIYEIGKLLEQTHEGAKEQLYQRLCTYFGVLEKNRFIFFRK